MPRAKTGDVYVSFAASKAAAVETHAFRNAKSHEVVWAHLHADHVHIWHNDGPPMTHAKITYEQYEYALATGQLR